MRGCSTMFDTLTLALSLRERGLFVTASPILKRTSLWLFLFFFPVSCQWLDQPPQTGHQKIAAAIRSLLDQAYAGADHTSYKTALQSLESLAAIQLDAVPSHLKAQVEQMLTNLRTAEEVLHWNAKQEATGDTSPTPANEAPLAAWIQRHAFLQAAVGAKADAPNTFDAETALNLLWDQANEILRDVQVKNSPI